MAIDQMALVDLLNNLRNQSPQQLSPDATGGSGSGDFMDMMNRNPVPPAVNDPRAALLQQAFAPNQPQLLPEEPQWSKGRMIGSQVGAALADALGAYAAGLGSPVRVNASRQLLERVQQGRFSREENARRKKGAEDESRQARARYELGQIDKADQQKREDDRFAAQRADRVAEREDEQAFRSQLERDRRTAEENAAKRSETIAKELAQLRADTEIKQERIRQEGKSDIDKVAARQEAQADRESTTQGIQYVVGTANGLQQLLSEPGATAEGVRKKAKRALDALGVRGKAREEVWRYWIEEVEPDLQAWEDANAPQQGPQQSQLTPYGQQDIQRIKPSLPKNAIGTAMLGGGFRGSF
jgi:hypothetical protein